MILSEIIDEIVDIFDGICIGDVAVSFDPLSSIFGGISPEEALDSVISNVGYKVSDGIEPSKEELEELLANLIKFSDTFKCRDVQKPIDDLKNYIKDINVND